VLELVFDIIVSIASTSTASNTSMARNAVDWLKEVCDEVIENSQKVLKTLGINYFLLLLSIWNAGEPPADKPTIASMLANPLRPKFNPLKTNQTMETTSKAQSQLKVDAEVPATQAIDISISRLNILEKSTLLSRDQVGVVTDDEGVKHETINSSSFSCGMVSLTEKYRLQVSCVKLIKLFITGTTGEVPTNGSKMLPIPTPTLLTTPTSFSPTHIAALLSFCLSISRFYQ
jgi:hypothetical protein